VCIIASERTSASSSVEKFAAVPECHDDDQENITVNGVVMR